MPEKIEMHVMSPMIVLQICPERISRFSEGREIRTEPAGPTELRIQRLEPERYIYPELHG